jgi:hypothetical protein
VALGSENDEVMEELRKCCAFDIPQFLPSPNIVVICDLRRVLFLGHVQCLEETRTAYQTLDGKSQG